jgi:hypothetical protein
MPSNFPKDPGENAFPEILGGDQAKQIDAVRAYLLTLGPGGGARTRPVAPASPAPLVGANQTER